MKFEKAVFGYFFSASAKKVKDKILQIVLSGLYFSFCHCPKNQIPFVFEY
jgi:hypothetical protein